MLAKGIMFEPSAPYFQEENGIAERKGRTLMERVRCTIIGGGIPDNLWPEILLAITHVSNLLPTSSLKGQSPFKASFKRLPNLEHLRILGSTVYVFIHEEEQKAKSTKWAPQGKHGVLVGYDGGTIYCVYLHDEGKVVRIKDLRIFENADEKEDSQVHSFDAIISSEYSPNNHIPKIKSPSSSISAPILEPTTNLLASVLFLPHITPDIGKPTTTRSGRVCQPPKRYDAEMNTDIKALLSQLVEVLDISDWGSNTQSSCSSVDSSSLDVCDPWVFLTQKIRTEDAANLDHYAYTTNSFDIQEPETYEKGMASEQAEEWVEAMREEMQSLIKHETWDLIPKNDITPGHRPLKGKWVYKIKRGVDNQILRFKARWVVKGYLQQVGVDFDQTFAAVVKPMAFRILFAITAFYNLDIEQMDVKLLFFMI